MFETKRADWHFIIPATLIWVFALIVTAWDFIQTQQPTYRFGFVNLLGLISILIGITIRRWAKKDLGKHFSPQLRTLNDHQLITTGIYQYVRHPAYSGNFLFWFGVPLLAIPQNSLLGKVPNQFLGVSRQKQVENALCDTAQGFLKVTMAGLFWVSRICREECRILGYERAYARSYPKMRGLTTAIPRETLF